MRRDKAIKENEQRKWSEVMKEGIRREMDKIEEIGYANGISEETASGMLTNEEEDDMQVSHIASSAECWDEIMQKDPDQAWIKGKTR